MPIIIYPSQFNIRADSSYEQLPAIQGPQGPQGIQGIQGPQGEDGQGPYEAAVEAGYTGTEEDFNVALAALPLHGARHLPGGDDPISYPVTSVNSKTGAVSLGAEDVGLSVLYLTGIACSATTGNFATKSDSNITANHVVTSIQLANPAAVTTNITWTTSAGKVVLNGTCTSATTASIVLIKKTN